MKRFKRKFTTLAMAAMVALTAVMPASASPVQSISIDSYSYHARAYDYGVKARIHVKNDGWSSSDRPIHFTFYGTNELYPPVQGTLYPEGSSYGDSEFTGEFYFENYGDPSYEYGFFDLDIWCSPYGSAPCEGSATLEILE